MKINKTTLTGILTIIWMIVSQLLVQKQILTIEQSVAIGGALVSLGLIAAKDGEVKKKQ